MATYGSTSVDGLLDGNLQFLNQGYGLTGYPDYGGFDGDPVNGNALIFLVKLGGSQGPIWLDTDLNKATGYSGYDYHVIWSSSGPPQLYSGSLGQTLVATLTDYAFVPNPQDPTAQPALEFAVPTNLIGGVQSAFATLGSGTSYVALPQTPGIPVVTIGAVALDGNLGEWTQAQRIDSAAPNPAMDVYGRIDGGNMIFALHLNSGDFRSASYTTLWLDTDFNRATGFGVPISNTSGAPQVQVGAEYNLRFDTAGHVILEKGNTLWPAYSENGAAVYSETVGPVPFAFSADYKSVEVAVPLAMLGANVTGADVHVDSSYGGGPALTADGYTVGTLSIAPPAPSAPDLVATSDTGPSSTDNITSVTIPTVTGNGAESGATVTLYDTGGTTVLGTAIADGSGNWSITSSTLNGGDHALTVKQTDLAGDVSGASAALTVIVAPPKTSIYVLQGINPAVIGAAPFDVKAISLYGDDKQLFTAAQVHQMGGGPGGGLLLGYLSVGEAETYRDYFASIPPTALGPEDPNFPGSFQVAYWTDAWRSVTTGIIDKMIALGFDGAVFDVVDEYQRPWAQRNAPGGAVAAMVDLVKYLSDYAHAQNPNFRIWVNGAPELLGNSTYLQAIDGMFMESLFYDGTGNTRPPTDTSYSMGFLDQALAANKSVINIEYVSGAAQIAHAHTKAAAAGIGSYIAHLDLKGIDMEGVQGLTVPAPASVTTGSGSDTLVLSMSEDAYLGDAQFTVAVDGIQLAGTFTTTALHAFGTSQTFTFMGDWGVGAHTVTVNLLNDAYGGTPATDRNLYVNAISYDGTASGQKAALMSTGPKSFSVTDTTAIPGTAILPPSVTTGSGSDTLVLNMSEDAYLGDAQFTVAVDGVQLAGTFTTTVSHASGGSQRFNFMGDWGVGPHTVTVKFLNDAYGGTPATDRNLYVNGISYDGATGLGADLKNGVPKSFAVTDTTAVTGSIIPPAITGSGPDQLVLSMSEDAYKGDAQFTVAVDGVQLGGTFATTAQRAAGAGQSFIFNGDWGVGAHTVTVKFLNDAYGGTPATDRNLYVNGVSYDGTATLQGAALMGGGPRSFAVTDIGSPGVIGSGSDTLVLGMSEDPYKGDVQFTVAVDGIQLAGTFTATALHSAGASQSFTFNGDWGIGNHTVTVELLNDLYAGTPDTDRNLYIDAISYDGTNTNQSAAVIGFVPNNFTVTDTTAIPSTAILPPLVSTGSGSDTLVLSMSEDAYKGDAQFTVSVDGRQLGGTFTTSAWHAAGESQSFIFKGDFGTGQHTVAVDFLNDAYAGTASTDRNLYVNGVSYNGTATGQTLALMAAGPKTFAVSGGTTPSVSEASDHGTLQENLSQVGTYNVGDDVVMLDSGNVGSVTLRSGASQISFIGASAIRLIGGSGTSVVTSDTGNNTFTAGTGGLDVTGGGGADAYVFHASSGLLTIEDFSIAKGDTLTVDKALQGSLVETSDGKGGTMLSFGTVGQGVDIHGIATMPSTDILWS